jgi:hypothetical protein
VYREVVLVCGVTGSGKTVWSKQFTASFNRLFVYDIAASFNVNYVDVDILLDVVKYPPDKFRMGVYSPYDTDVLTASAYLLGNCWLVLEEISTLYNIGARVHGPLQEAILLGRQRALSLLVISQRASYIPITLRSQASRIISFRQQEPSDIKWLADFIGKDAQILPTLPDLTCIDWHKGELSRYAISLPRMTNTQTNIQTNTHADYHSDYHSLEG